MPRAILRRRLLTITLALLVLNLVLVFLVEDNRSLATDLAIARELQEPRGVDTFLLPFMVLVSEPGYLPWRIVLLVLAVAAPLLAGYWRIALLINLTLIGDVTTVALKALVGRPRPTLEQLAVYGHDANPSFPSGHVVQYVVFFGLLAYLSWGGMSQKSSKPRRVLSWSLFVISVALICLVGFSRVFLGAHWPTDVLAGYLVGTVLLVGLIAIDRRILRKSVVSSQAGGRTLKEANPNT